MNHLAIARASCEGREGTHPALRPNGSGLMVITILASDGGSNPPCGTRRFMNQQNNMMMEKEKTKVLPPCLHQMVNTVSGCQDLPKMGA